MRSMARRPAATDPADRRAERAERLAEARTAARDATRADAPPDTTATDPAPS